MRAPRFHARVHPLNLLAALLLASPAAVLAQNSPPPATGAPPPASADASLPSAPTTPLAYQGIAPQPALADAAPTATSWRDAHGAVAAFPRGHADIVHWEAHNAAATVAPRTPSPPAATTDGTPHPGMRHQMPQQMHDKGPHPMPHGHHTNHPTTPQGGRP